MPDDMGARFVRNHDMIWTGVDGETVLLSIDRGEYFGLGGVGGCVWEMLAKPVTADEICGGLVAEFDVDPAVCRADLAAFLSDLLESGIVRQCLQVNLNPDLSQEWRSGGVADRNRPVPDMPVSAGLRG